MIYFNTRAQARKFAKGTKKVIDCAAKGNFSCTGRRWAVKI